MYGLEEVNFKTFDGTTVDAPFSAGKFKFEVVQESEDAPQNIEDVPIVVEELDAPIVIEELSITRRL